MSVLNFIGNILKPITGLISDLVTTDKEKSILTNELLKIENQLSSKVLDYESKLMAVQAKIVEAEVKGQSALQRNWRPITMLTFLILVVCDSFGLLVFRLAPEAWSLLKIGLSGYVIGRSVEKITPTIADAIKSRNGK